MLFMIAATWADRLKSHSDYHTDGPHHGNRPPNDPSAGQNIGYDDLARHKYSHFVDLPFSNDSTALPPVPTPNAQTQIDKFRAVLNSTSADPNVETLTSYDLSWLLHLVGDLHQPLHATTHISATQLEGDDGGSGVKLDSPANLHTSWDGVLGKGDAPLTALNAVATLPDAPTTAVSDVNVDHWISGRFDVAQAKVYKAPVAAGAGPFMLTPTYKAAARKLADARIALAGARLAKILNAALR